MVTKAVKGNVAQTLQALNGGEVVAHAMRQANPDVVPVYPVTPQTIITETFSEFVADGRVVTELVHAESEHGAMGACIGAAAAGARVQTATSGPGLALMWELLGVASGLRLPIVMHLCARALSAPLNILGDHSDAMAMRDTGWVMLMGESPQEGYDNGLMAVRIAEHPEVRLPVASVLDGFFATHSVERVKILPDDAAADYVGVPVMRDSLLEPGKAVSYGTMDFHDYYFEHKRQQIEAMTTALGVVDEVSREYARLSGRYYGLLEPYRLDDAQAVLVVMGSAAGSVRAAVDALRRQGHRVGMLRVRCFRPFPVEAVADAISHVDAVGVLDRALAVGGAGHPLYLEVLAAVSKAGQIPRVTSLVYGLGGRDTPPERFRQAFMRLLDQRNGRWSGAGPIYLGLREEKGS